MKKTRLHLRVKRKNKSLKWLLFLLFAFYCFSLSAQREFDIYFNSSDFETTSNNGKIYLNTFKPLAAYSDDTSKPAFPLFPCNILIPEDSISIIYNVSFESNLIFSDVDIEKNQPAMTTNGEIIENFQDNIVSIMTPVFDANEITYGDYQYVCLLITPFLYDAVNKNLYFVSHVKISIPSFPSTIGSSAILDWPLEYRDFAESLANFGDFGNFYTIPSRAYNNSNQQPLDYVIITSQALSSSFHDLADWKRRKGYRTEIVTTDSIYNNFSGIDNQQKIKNYLYSNKSRGIKFVLLGGDDSIVPCRYCTSNFRQTPADIYYSCFSDFTNGDWDQNNNGIYGEAEDNINFNPSFILSRLPIRTTNDVTNYTTKLIQYEMATDTLSTNRILLTGYNNESDGHASAKYYNNYLYQNYIQPFWNGKKYYMYENEGFLPGNTSYPISKSNLNYEINRGYNIIHEVSHGDTISWNLNDGNYTIYDAASQTNSLPSIIVSNACHTNAFHKEPCLSEAFIRNPNGGALAYFGSSIEGFSSGTTFNGSFMYDGFFFQFLYLGLPYNTPYCFGGVAKMAKQNMLSFLNVFSYNRLLQLSINPMGDPEMPIFTDKPLSFVHMNGLSITQPMILINPTQKKITVQSTTDSCRIVLLEDNGNIQVFDNVQNATFNTHYGLHKITILKHNYTPYLANAYLDSIPNLPGPITMNIRKEGNNYIITALRTVTEDGNYYCVERIGDELANWKILISNIMTGETKVNTIITTSSFICDTSSWENGIFTVQVKDEENIIQKKIIITK